VVEPKMLSKEVAEKVDGVTDEKRDDDDDDYFSVCFFSVRGFFNDISSGLRRWSRSRTRSK